MKNRVKHNPIQGSAGFIVADFLFAFVLVISIGIFIFGLTFSLATIEIAQYIVWSTARNYAAANISPPAAQATAKMKFQNLTAAFPLLTGNGSSDPWFELLESNLFVGDLSVSDPDFAGKLSADDKTNKHRQPWSGASAKINLKLFAGFKIPFLGKVARDQADFEFPIRAFIIRNPSREECRNFFYNLRYVNGIKKLENNTLAPGSSNGLPGSAQTTPHGSGEDNGC